MKRISTIILLLLYLGAMVIPGFAVEDSPSSEEAVIAMDLEDALSLIHI